MKILFDDPYDSRVQRGFTLLEVLIVIAVLGILTGIGALAASSATPVHRLNGAMSLLRGDLYTAKVRAVKNNRQYKVAFTAGGYQIQRGTTGSGAFVLGSTEITRTFATDYPGVSVKTAVTNVQTRSIRLGFPKQIRRGTVDRSTRSPETAQPRLPPRPRPHRPAGEGRRG